MFNKKYFFLLLVIAILCFFSQKTYAATIFTGPTFGAVNATSTDFTITPDSSYDVGTLTPTDGGVGGIFSPSSIPYTSSANHVHFTYTPSSTGIKTISFTGNPSLTIPAPIQYNSQTWSSNFLDNFNRADGLVGNGWQGPTGTLLSISSGVLNVLKGNGNPWATGVILRPVEESPTLNQRTTVDYLSGSTGDMWLVFRSSAPGTQYFIGISHSGLVTVMSSTAGNLNGAIGGDSFVMNPAHNYRLDASVVGTYPTNLRGVVTDLTTATVVADYSIQDSTTEFQQNGQLGFFVSQSSVSADNFQDYSLGEPAPATSYTLSGPNNGYVNATSTNFTVKPNGSYTGTITPHTSGSGYFTPTSLYFSSSSAAQTFIYTPTSTNGSPHSISVTSSPTLTDPSPISYAINVPPISFNVDNPNLYWSKENVYVNGSSYALMLTTGSYLKTNFSGTAVSLGIDVSALNTAGVSAINYPLTRYQVDGGSWTSVQLTSTTTSIEVQGLSSGTHSFRFEYISANTFTDKWNTPVNAIKVTGISIDQGSSLSFPNILSKRLRVDGDSITEGLRVIDGGDTPFGNSAVLDYAYLLSSLLNTELTQIGYGGTGWLGGGQGNVPAYPTSIDYYYDGVSRLVGGVLPTPPDYWIVNLGTNDGGNITTSVFNNLVKRRAEAGPTTELFVIVPFYQGVHRSEIQAAFSSYTSTYPSDTKVHILDLGETNYGATDLAHPNVAGHQLLANLLFGAINTELVSISADLSMINKDSVNNTVTITGVNTSWTAGTPGSPTFNITGGSGASINSQTIVDSTHAILSISAGTSLGNLNISDSHTGATTTVTVVPDLTAPLLSSINVSSINQTGATITWTTDEGADTKINYGTSGSYTSSTTLDSNLVTSHTVVLLGLTAGTMYHYQIISKDLAGNIATSTDRTFTTTSVPVSNGGGGGGGYSFSRRGVVVAVSNTPNPISTPTLLPTLSPDSVKLSKSFSIDLKTGVSSNQVKTLQQYLNSIGFTISKTNAGSKGKETNYFGPATKAVLIKFQKANGITPAIGYFGPKTRLYISTH